MTQFYLLLFLELMRVYRHLHALYIIRAYNNRIKCCKTNNIILIIIYNHAGIPINWRVCCSIKLYILVVTLWGIYNRLN